MNDEYTINQDELEDEPSQQSKPPKRPTGHYWKRAFKWLAVTIILLVVLAVAYVAFNFSKVSINPLSFGHLKGEDQGRINIMMLGVGDPGHDGEKLSDTNMVLSIDAKTHKIAVISVPRDTRVYIPRYGYSKINNANAQGGVSTAKQVLQNNLGVPIHYYVKANFTGLKEVVDAVGGVDVTNTTLLSDPEYPCDSNQFKRCGFRLPPGHYHLNGTTALKYVRCRKGTCGNDFGRAQRQQEVMQAIRSKASSAGTLTNPIRMARLVSAAGKNIDTDLSANNMLRLQELTKQAGKGSIYNVVFNLEPGGFLMSDPAGSSDLLPKGGDFDEIKEFVQHIFSRAPIWTEHSKVLVENGTSTAGLGGRYSKKLQASQPDITVSGVTNAVTATNPTSRIIDYSGGKRPNTIKYLEGMLKVKATLPAATPGLPKTSTSDIVIIVGDDYAAANPASSSTTTTPSTSGASSGTYGGTR